jgi:hypothetical protein
LSDHFAKCLSNCILLSQPIAFWEFLCVFKKNFLSQICKWTQFRPQLHSLVCWESLIYPNYSSVKKLQARFSIWYYCFSSKQVVVSASLEFLNKTQKKSKHLVIVGLIDFLPIFFVYLFLLIIIILTDIIIPLSLKTRLQKLEIL